MRNQEGFTLDRLTSEAADAVSRARLAAQRLRHAYVGPHHVLLGIIEEGSAFSGGVLAGVDRDRLRRAVEAAHPPGNAAAPPPPDWEAFTRDGFRVLSLGGKDAEFYGDQRVGVEHLLLALSEHGMDDGALESAGATFDALRDRVVRRPRVGAPGAQPETNFRPCVRHPDQYARFSCTRCGDFACARCMDLAGELCAACRSLPPPPPPSRGIALYLAIFFALLSGLFLLGLSLLAYGLSRAPGAGTTGLLGWNSIIGCIYFWIAFGLWRRTRKGYSWSIGTQGLNALLAAFRLFTTPGNSTVVTAIIGFQLAVHALGWIATRAAKHEFPPH